MDYLERKGPFWHTLPISQHLLPAVKPQDPPISHPCPHSLSGLITPTLYHRLWFHPRRPNLATEDGYFAARYHADTLALELEATLAAQLANLVARHERQLLAATHASAAAAASGAAVLAAAAGAGPGAGAGAQAAADPVAALWKPGYHPGTVYGGVLMVRGTGGVVQRRSSPAGGGVDGWNKFYERP